jgi:hypothetical protein
MLVLWLLNLTELLNSENVEKQLTLDLSFVKNKKSELITSPNNTGDEPLFDLKKINGLSTRKMNITLQSNDGFVAVFE